EQIKIAAGEKLSFSQDDIILRGHALECRIYAEDPASNFMPSIGVINFYQEPGGPGVRVDSGVYEGAEISVYYDPMIAKLITYGQNRAQAIDKMIRALSEYRIGGVTSNIDFHKQILAHPEFVAGHLSTDFINTHYRPSETAPETLIQAMALAVALSEHESRSNLKPTTFIKNQSSKWKSAGRIPVPNKVMDRGWK
ncbi:MAG TPA: biotin carboxylase, partial [candidate division Zixibacteria bacterium]|nr:biotin carboxylase [candidate division Zixibacteria bacterium]